MSTINEVLLYYLKKNYNDDDIIDILYNIYIDVYLKNINTILAHMYYLIDKSHDVDISSLKNKCKNFVYSCKLDDNLVAKSKLFLKKLLNDESLDFINYDSDTIDKYVSFLMLYKDKDKKFISLKNYEKNENDAMIKPSYSDYKNLFFGSATYMVSKNNKIVKIRYYNNLNENVQKKDNKYENDFINYVINVLNLHSYENEIKDFWSFYKNCKSNKLYKKDKDHKKIRNRYIHFLYIIKLVTNITFNQIKNIIYLSIYNIDLSLLFNNIDNKLHKNIELSFDKFFSSFGSSVKNTYKKNHENNKKVKLLIDDNLYVRISVFVNSKKVLKIKNLINEHENYNKDLIFNILQNEDIKLTKKEIEQYIIRHY